MLAIWWAVWPVLSTDSHRGIDLFPEIANLKPQFLDATTKDEFTRFVIEQSGLDLQLFLAAPSGR
jgi:hypothetical protein